MLKLYDIFMKSQPSESEVRAILSRVLQDRANLLRWIKIQGIFRSQFAEIRSLKNRFANHNLLIVGNGPSSAKLDPSQVAEFRSRGGLVMGMNFANTNPALSDIPLDFYVSADRRPAQDRPLHDYLKTHEKLQAFFPEIRTETWQIALPQLTIFSFCRVRVRFLRAPWWGNSPDKPKRFMSSTGLHAVQIAQWLGFTNIFVIGLDNTYFREFEPNSHGSFTQRMTHAGEKDFFESFSTDTATYLRAQSQLFQDFWIFSGSNIFNLDKFSYTDAFEKVDFSSALVKAFGSIPSD